MLFEQVAFNAGQLSDSMKARSDFVKFNNGCAVAKNCLLKTQGPIFNRPGTQYIAPTKETSLPVRLIKFEFSELDAYALEFGNQYIRVYRQRGQLLDADAPYEIASPYGSSDLADLQFIQSGDIMRIVSANHPPHLLKRMGHTNWVIEQAPYTNGPYMPENATPTQLRAEYKPELVDEWQDDTDYAEGDFRKVSGDPDRFFSCIFPHTSDTTVTHPIDGESNDLYWREFEAGDYIPAGAPVEITELTGTEANFNEGHIGSKWQISHERDDRTISEDMGSTGTNETDAIPVFGAWTFRTGGSWVGFVRIQRSLDGAEWTTLQQYRSDTDYNVDTTGTETNDNAFYRIQFERESGTARVNFFNDQEFHDGEVEITEILDSEGEDAEKDGSAFDSYDDAVAHWKLDETSGTTAVDSKGDNDATLSGTTFDAITIAGKVGTAVRIDNSNTQEINGGAVFTNEQAMSFAMWIKPEYVRSGVHWFLSTTNTSTSGELLLGWDSRNGGRMVYHLRGSGYYFYTPDSSSPVNEWVHVVYTRQQNTAAQWYINGEQVFNGSAELTIPHGDLLIGVNSASFYRGGIDNVIVYDRMLTSAEVSQLYLQTAPGAMGKVTVPLYKDAATTPTKRWAEALWSDYRGWPESVEGYEQRVIYGGNRQFPDHIVFSKTGDPDNLRIGSQDDAAMIRVLPGQNPVQWMKGRKGISLGTLNAAGRITGSGGDSEAITPESYLFEEHAFRGSAKVQPVLAGDSMLFVERGRKKVREFAYSLERDMYMAPDMTMLAEDIAGSGFKEIHFQSRPDSLVWGVTYDGYLAVMAYERQEQDVVGWTPIETDGIVESICIVPGAEEDEVYMVVQREADGQSVRYVEVMAPQGWGELKNAWYVDSGLKWSGGAERAVTDATGGEGESGTCDIEAMDNADYTNNGDGTEGNPFRMFTVAHWQQFMADTLNMDKYFILCDDIDLDGISCTPVHTFSGNFNGNGKKILNLSISDVGENTGLFGLITGNVFDLGIIDSDLSVGSYSVGALVGVIGDSGTVKRCYSANGSVTGSLAGGLVGSMYKKSYIDDCWSSCTAVGNNAAGGLIGYISSPSESTIHRCFSYGHVSGGANPDFKGGLIGAMHSSVDPVVTSSYYNSQTSGQSDDVGLGSPKTTEEMKQQVTYDGWDFEIVWGIEADQYPQLKSPQSIIVIFTSPEHGFVDEDLVQLFGTVRIDGTSFDGVYEIADATGDTFKLKDIETNEYIDGSLLGEYDGKATVVPVTKEVEGLDHLEGRTVSILADGTVHERLEVESGEITLDDYYNTIIVGLPYESEFRSLPVSLLTQSGTSRGWLKKTKRIYLEFIRSLGAVYGAPDGDLRPIRFAPYTDAQDGTEPFTGLQELPLLAGFDKDAVVRVVQKKPLPFMLTRMIREVDLNAG